MYFFLEPSVREGSDSYPPYDSLDDYKKLFDNPKIESVLIVSKQDIGLYGISPNYRFPSIDHNGLVYSLDVLSVILNHKVAK
jgi:hypothetical protein